MGSVLYENTSASKLASKPGPVDYKSHKVYNIILTLLIHAFTGAESHLSLMSTTVLDLKFLTSLLRLEVF